MFPISRLLFLSTELSSGEPSAMNSPDQLLFWCGSEDILTEKSKPVYPGEAPIEEFLKPWGISQNQLGVSISVTKSRVNEIVCGRRGITGDTGLRLSRATGTTPEFWLNLQSLYDLETAKDELGDRLEEEITPVIDVSSLEKIE
jgi:addiction module HigA family antidote